MENDDGLAVPGPSGTQIQQNKSPPRKRRLTSSSSNASSSSSSSSSSESSQDSKRKRRYRRQRRSKKQKRRHKLLEKLSKEVGELRKNMMSYDNNNYRDNDNESFLSDVSRELYNDFPSRSLPSPNIQSDDITPNLTFDMEIKVKDPQIPSTPSSFLKMLNEAQHFGSHTWSDVRYAETQKLYNYSPGFTELETNEEVKEYDNIRHLAYSDKSYAAITFCILKQKEIFLDGCRSLLAWSRASDASLSNLEEKIDEIFLKGNFHKVSTDLLQMACGHRAENIEMRRDSILKCVRDPLIKCKLNKIPPTDTHLFQAESFTTVIENAGGVKKAFWPANQLNKGNASRAKLTNTTRHPSQGYARRNVPSRGTHGCCDSVQTLHASCHHQPSQGNHVPNYMPKELNNAYHRYDYNPNVRGSSFRSRGSKQRQPSQRGQKRHFSPSDIRTKGNKRHKQ